MDFDATKKAFEELCDQVNQYNRKMGSREVTVYECALGYIKVANETMSRPIRSLTQARGFNPKSHILDIFGGAGAQHACSIARDLGIRKIYIHKYCGILSAYGLGLADVVHEAEEPIKGSLSQELIDSLQVRFAALKVKNI